MNDLPIKGKGEINMGLNGASSFQVSNDLMRAKVKEYSAKLLAIKSDIEKGKAKPEDSKSVEDSVSAFAALVKIGDSVQFQENSNADKNVDGGIKQQEMKQASIDQTGRVNPKSSSASLSDFGRDGDKKFLASA